MTTPTEAAEEFFYKHAGWSYNPKTETAEEGRRRCAREMAAVERDAASLGIRVTWQPDPFPVDHVKEFDCYDAEPETCEVAIAYGPDGALLASLGCVDDATPEYRRVVEAELADEAIAAMPEPEWRQTACAECGQDIEGIIGEDAWRDRGGNAECVPYVTRGEVTCPPAGTIHRPADDE